MSNSSFILSRFDSYFPYNNGRQRIQNGFRRKSNFFLVLSILSVVWNRVSLSNKHAALLFFFFVGKIIFPANQSEKSCLSFFSWTDAAVSHNRVAGLAFSTPNNTGCHVSFTFPPFIFRSMAITPTQHSLFFLIFHQLNLRSYRHVHLQLGAVK